MTEKIADESLCLTVIKILANPSLRAAGIRCITSIFYNFFFLQYKAAFLRRIPISWVDHHLDAKIPFIPKWVTVYLGFIAFWVRMVGFMLRKYQRSGIKPTEDFINSMEKIYPFAAEVYLKNLSTTNRPCYLTHPQFILIHGTDPHLMCIPSLHVMVVIHTYTKFRAMIHSLGDAERFTPQIEEIRQGALDITQAILFVKQHSVNCVAAAMYAMTQFDGSLFPKEEAACFISHLFSRSEIPNAEDRKIIRTYILELYTWFLEKGYTAQSWEEPLLVFLRSHMKQ